MPASSCPRWQAAAPRVVDKSPEQKWIVHRAETVYGLGDYLAGLLSAFVLAAATDRRLFVDHPFGDLVSFAPYNVTPPREAWSTSRTVRVELNTCPEWDSLIGTADDNSTRVLIYGRSDHVEEGIGIPANRACAWSWRENLKPIWRALGGELWRDDHYDEFLTRSHVVYGCILNYFQPTDLVTDAIPQLDVDVVIGVHSRSGDDTFRENGKQDCATEVNRRQVSEIITVRDTIEPGKTVGYRIESDSACVREFLAEHVAKERPGDVVAPAIAKPAHNIIATGAGKQLASWFALSTVDIFIVSPMYGELSPDPTFDKYAHCPPQFYKILAPRKPGFADHGYLRLSSWSIMAALRAGTTRMHVICAKAPPNGWEKLSRLVPIPRDQIPDYACDTTIPSVISLVTDPTRGYVHVNAHFLFVDELSDAKSGKRKMVWGVGNFM